MFENKPQFVDVNDFLEITNNLTKVKKQNNIEKPLKKINKDDIIKQIEVKESNNVNTTTAPKQSNKTENYKGSDIQWLL